MTDKQYDDAILDSNAIDPTDVDGNPIPVTIPIMLAPGVKSRVHHATLVAPAKAIMRTAISETSPAMIRTMCSPIVWRSPTPSTRS